VKFEIGDTEDIELRWKGETGTKQRRDKNDFDVARRRAALSLLKLLSKPRPRYAFTASPACDSPALTPTLVSYRSVIAPWQLGKR
jgi:hypothetical protein